MLLVRLPLHSLVGIERLLSYGLEPDIPAIQIRITRWPWRLHFQTSFPHGGLHPSGYIVTESGGVALLVTPGP
jgi:hypothetical protein